MNKTKIVNLVHKIKKEKNCEKWCGGSSVNGICFNKIKFLKLLPSCKSVHSLQRSYLNQLHFQGLLLSVVQPLSNTLVEQKMSVKLQCDPHLLFYLAISERLDQSLTPISTVYVRLQLCGLNCFSSSRTKRIWFINILQRESHHRTEQQCKQRPKNTKNSYFLMSVASWYTPCFVMFCVFLYGPFCHGAHKLDWSTLFTTFFL